MKHWVNTWIYLDVFKHTNHKNAASSQDYGVRTSVSVYQNKTSSCVFTPVFYVRIECEVVSQSVRNEIGFDVNEHTRWFEKCLLCRATLLLEAFSGSSPYFSISAVVLLTVFSIVQRSALWLSCVCEEAQYLCFLISCCLYFIYLLYILKYRSTYFG